MKSELQELILAKTLMIQGTCSDAGKSILTAALCRIYARRGYAVSPFKSQNMALNSFVTREGLEIGRAQAVQAAAAGLAPRIDMNPILLKPEGNSRSQVVLMGKPWKTLSAAEYYEKKRELWAEACGAMDRLHRDFDLIIAEGAGSPAEINLQSREIVNMAVARYLNAPVLLTGDIDRGGVFASLYGTWQLVGDDRSRIAGFLINKFRGDPKLLTPGLKMLEDLCGGVPVTGVIPMIPDLALAREDSVFLENRSSFGDPEGLPLVVIKLPHISNYDDFDPFLREKGIHLIFARSPAEIPPRPAAILLPGTKTTIQDLNWLEEKGLAARIRELARRGCAVAGICGGYQMLGREIRDPEGIESAGGRKEGLGLLPLETVFTQSKTTCLSEGRLTGRGGFFQSLADSPCGGYEIHMGTTEADAGVSPLYRSPEGRREGAVSSDGKIWGSYLHGIFDNSALRRGFLGSLGWQGEAGAREENDLREAEFERLADAVEEVLDRKALDRIIGLG